MSYYLYHIRLKGTETLEEGYIGRTKDPKDRWKQHKLPSVHAQQPNSPLYAAMSKYGIENFEFVILEEGEKAVIVQREAELRPNPNMGLNVDPGGVGKGGKHSEKGKENIRNALAAVMATEEYKEKHAEGTAKRTLSEEGRQKIPEVQKARDRSKDDRSNLSEDLTRYDYYYDGVHYTSLMSAADAAGCSRHTFINRCKSPSAKFAKYIRALP